MTNVSAPTTTQESGARGRTTGEAKRSIVGLKWALSLFLIFHLSAVVVLPNAGSLLGRQIGDLFVRYGNLLIFNRTWQFFSPGPMPNMFLEYDVETKENELLTDRPSRQWPEQNKNGLLDDWFLRSVAGMRFLAIDQQNFETYFIPYLCRQNPGATALDLRSIVESPKNIEHADDVAEFNDLQERTDLPRKRYECPGREVGPGADGGTP